MIFTGLNRSPKLHNRRMAANLRVCNSTVHIVIMYPLVDTLYGWLCEPFYVNMFVLHGSRSGGSDQIRGIIIIFHIHGVRRRQEIIRDYENCVVSKEENLRRKNAQPFCCEKVFHTCQLIKIPPLLDILIFLFFVVSCRECEPSSSAVSCYITPDSKKL